MKVTIKPGEVIDLLSPGDLEQIIEEHLAGYLRPPQWIRPVGGISLNSSGNSAAADSQQTRIYEVKAGYSFKLHRLVLDLDAFTPGAPYTNATGYAEIQRNGEMVDFFALKNGLPAVFSAGRDGPVFFGNESLSVFVVGGPASSSLLARAEGTLQPFSMD